MCEPVTIGLAISAAAAAASYVQAEKASKKQDKAIYDAAVSNNEQTAAQYEENNQQAAQSMQERAKEGMIERARLRVISGESGLQGATVDRITDESLFNEGTDITTIEANRFAANKQAKMNGAGGAAKLASRQAAIDRPSLLGTGLQIAGAAVGQQAEQARVQTLGTRQQEQQAQQQREQTSVANTGRPAVKRR